MFAREVLPMTVGDRIRKRRIELDLSQEELAKRMGYSGKSTICKAETWGNEITTTKVKKFADALNVSFEYLMGWDAKEQLTQAYAQAERDGEILNVVRQLNDANAQIVLNLATSLLAQQ